MRTSSCLCCLLLALVLAAAPLLPTAVGLAQPAATEPGNDMAPTTDDEDEDGGNEAAERELRPTAAAPRSDYQLGLVRRADTFAADAEEADGTRPAHAVQLAYPDHDVVVCEAGCDGPAGAIVYLRKRQPRPAE